jgi:transglutaminase-like putative cysteine protease
MRWMTHIFAVVLFATLMSIGLASRAGSPNSFAEDSAAAQSRSLQFTSVTHVPALPSGARQLKIWVPLPYVEHSQLISNLQVLTPVSYKIEHEKEYDDRYAYVVVNADDAGAPFDVRVTFHVQRFEHRVLLTPSNNGAGEAGVLTARFLQPDHLVPLDGVINELSIQHTAGAATPLDKARQIYDYVVASMHYDHDGTGWGHGDAVWACEAKHGNCTDFHSVFIGMARAAGIPARFEIGFSIPANAHEGAISGYHCWAQFYVKGIGWVPIDASEAWKNPAKREYFFGATDQNRVMFSLGRDIRLKPAQKSEPLNYFVYPYAELDGKPFTQLKNEYSFRDDSVPEGPAKGVSTSD